LKREEGQEEGQEEGHGVFLIYQYCPPWSGGWARSGNRKMMQHNLQALEHLFPGRGRRRRRREMQGGREREDFA
jgi:hypothetical protein